jgi:hypothetical protein
MISTTHLVHTSLVVVASRLILFLSFLDNLIERLMLLVEIVDGNYSHFISLTVFYD